MANNRLYLVDKTSKHYICIAKEFNQWEVGNVNLLQDFLNDFSQSQLEVVEENDPNFLNTVDGFINYNLNNKWETYGK